METAYREWEKRRPGRSGRHTGAERNRRKKYVLGLREQRRLFQLTVCIVLFFVVFIGKGVFPEQMASVRDEILGAIQADTDFKAAFANLGRSISAGEPVMNTLGELWIDVFGRDTVEVDAQVPLESAATYQAEQAFLTGDQGRQAAFHLAGLSYPIETEEELEPPPSTPPQTEQAEDPLQTAQEVIPMPYDGIDLPDNASMDRFTLGLAQTVTPVVGWVSSAFGWREHPVDGEEKFHNGVDLAVNNGTEVKAFADGVVDYIGDSPIYGLYLQLRHDNGITTFYAHCGQLCVQQGQTVTAGEKVAESGDTGNATGPHLHFEMKKDGVLLNPIYYIETQ